MKTILVPLLLAVFLCSPLPTATTLCLFAQSAANNQVAETNKKIEHDVLEAEKQLKQAIRKCDLGLLDRLLMDYYADSSEGSERATTKRATIAHCQQGSLVYYAIVKKKKLSIRGDIVELEGISNARPASTDREGDSLTWIRRLWTKKDGRWQLMSQTRQALEEHNREVKN